MDRRGSYHMNKGMPPIRGNSPLILAIKVIIGCFPSCISCGQLVDTLRRWYRNKLCPIYMKPHGSYIGFRVKQTTKHTYILFQYI